MFFNNFVKYVTSRDIDRDDTLYSTKAQHRFMVVTRLIVTISLWWTVGPAIVVKVGGSHGL